MPLYNSQQEELQFKTTLALFEVKAAEWLQGYLRYEILRKCNPSDYAKLWERSLKGERFDDLVDEMLKEYQKETK